MHSPRQYHDISKTYDRAILSSEKRYKQENLQTLMVKVN
jgi:hypothetical protein